MTKQIIIISLALLGASAFSAETNIQADSLLTRLQEQRNNVKQQLKNNAAEIFNRINSDGGDVFEFLKKKYNQPNMDHETALFYLDRKGYHPDVKQLFKKRDELDKKLGELRSKINKIQNDINKLQP